jgi:hypothetical protein
MYSGIESGFAINKHLFHLYQKFRLIDHVIGFRLVTLGYFPDQQGNLESELNLLWFYVHKSSSSYSKSQNFINTTIIPLEYFWLNIIKFMLHLQFGSVLSAIDN